MRDDRKHFAERNVLYDSKHLTFVKLVTGNCFRVDYDFGSIYATWNEYLRGKNYG